MAAAVVVTKSSFMAAAAAAAAAAWLLFLLGCLPGLATAASFSFSYSGFSMPSNNVTLQGNAAFGNAGCINITGNIASTMGRVSYTLPVQLWDAATGEVASFTTRFSINIIPNDTNNKGDGMAFFLVSHPSRMPDTAAGGTLGLTSWGYDSVSPGDNRFVAVEFDTFNNSFDPMDTYDHIGIDLVNATKSFAAEEKLGQGGFGAVYRGHLSELGLAVAIKRFAKESSGQGRKEYTSEIKVISRLGHRNLVQLIGWCHDHGELLLVYELVPNRSLDIHLHDHGNGTFLTWPMSIL
ncbi:hypothetical protein GUJ93_ZPchr0008g12022 [Zizania palustris]|uniref:non-specific serine/threonine protein kinase n=1 Tax=Zizania palustris TaxID=103762 RepID=A0A8J5UWH0_ZIZPA|nr:hypothetical protein GUJ93_ZPchr0008g12022 [Zizania palustris]